MYAIYVGDLESAISRDCMILQYADDVAIASSLTPVAAALRSLQETLARVDKSLADVGLSLAPEKTALVVFERKRQASNGGSKSIKLGSSIIRESRVVRFLGLKMSRDLNWGPQVRKIVSKCQNPLKILSCLRHTWWGADIALLIRLYIAIVRSRIEYASFLFCDLSRTQSLTLNRIQFKALRLAMGYRTSTPTNVILAESGQPPLSLRFRYLGRNYVTRVLSDSTHRVTSALQEILDFIENPVNVGGGGAECYRDHLGKAHLVSSSSRPLCYEYAYESILFQPDVSFKEGFCIQRASDCRVAFSGVFSDCLRSSKCFYTDGSKMSDSTYVGFAFVCQDGEPHPFRSVGWSSIFTAEAMAIVETLFYIFTLRGNDSTIFPDSHSVFAALNFFPNLQSKTYLIFHIKDQLYRLRKSGKKVKLYWIPAHGGIIGNELVDRAAKSASVIGRDT